jgi:hypothetical protein
VRGGEGGERGRKSKETGSNCARDRHREEENVRESCRFLFFRVYRGLRPSPENLWSISRCIPFCFFSFLLFWCLPWTEAKSRGYVANQQMHTVLPLEMCSLGNTPVFIMILFLIKQSKKI